MNLCTVSGVYENSRKIVRLLNCDHLGQQLEVIAKDPKKLAELSIALDALESHIRVMGFEEAVFTTGV